MFVSAKEALNTHTLKLSTDAGAPARSLSMDARWYRPMARPCGSPAAPACLCGDAANALPDEHAKNKANAGMVNRDRLIGEAS